MALASSIFHLGGISDAISKGVKEPELHVSPLGDIMSRPDFEDEVIGPFGRTGTEKRVTYAISEYPEQYEAPIVLKSVEDRFDPEFVAAWKAEVGFTIDQGRRIVEIIEDDGTNRNAPVFSMVKSALINKLAAEGLDRESAQAFVTSMTLPIRPSWKTIPEGYLPHDREPWRFRRRLSMMRRPLVVLDESNDPLLLITPGFLRDAFVYVLRGFREGTFPDQNYPTSREMSKWLGRVKNERGKAFNKLVEARMLELGWKAVCELKVTELLSKGFPERDYGDIDVFAWNEKTGRMLVMECKDLLFGKTPGEIAHQLTEFLGEQDERGKRDSLRKHMDRMEIISKHIERAVKYAKLTVPPRLESHLIFRNPVPMQFAWKDLQAQARLSLFDDLEKL
jgi:hypothetical protein